MNIRFIVFTLALVLSTVALIEPAFCGEAETQNSPATPDLRAEAGVSDEVIEQARLVARADDDKKSVTKKAESATDSVDTLAGAAHPAATAASAADAAAESLSLDQTKKLKESEIPLAPLKEQKKSESQPWQKMVISLGILAALLGAASVALKKWNKDSKNKNLKNTKIKVLTQHYLGPKKSILIVQVAGESILLGVTDHNISMLKTLSLIDDEIPDSLPKNFAGEISDEFIEADEFALKGLADIRDKVSTRLKTMRTF
jgi:flagellar protein FliO/FliZ